MTANLEEAQKTKRPPRAVTVVLVIVLGLHLLAMFLWISPNNALTDLVAKPLRAYALPWFQQSWSLFAPDPIKAGTYLEVRAVPEDYSESEWQTPSETELEGLHHNPLPPLSINTTNKLSEKAWGAYSALKEEDRTILTWNYHNDAWTRMAPELTGSPEAKVDAALTYDEAITAYATQYLSATGNLNEGDYVQYRFVRVAVPSFNERLEKDNTTSITFTSGRRPQTVLATQDAEGFAKVLEAVR